MRKKQNKARNFRCNSCGSADMFRAEWSRWNGFEWNIAVSDEPTPHVMYCRGCNQFRAGQYFIEEAYLPSQVVRPKMSAKDMVKV